MGTQLVYMFAAGKADGQGSQKELLGGKGANLAEMTNLGIPVPPGFTISTEACAHYTKVTDKGGLEAPDRFAPGLWDGVGSALKRLEDVTGRKLGDAKRPLLVSVRSGAAASMPGMMDTILNLGLNGDTVEGLAKETQNPRFAWDSYRRFIHMFSNVVLGIAPAKFEKLLHDKMHEAGAKRDSDLSADALEALVPGYLALVKAETGHDFPNDPMDALRASIEAVLQSWNNERAKVYRRIHKITGLLGTAVNVQAMVFGNMGEDSGTGVCFTRDPSTGERKPYGEFLTNAQGEDVVAGVRTPLPLADMDKVMPKCSRELHAVMDKLERHFKDVQDMEFTVERGKLYLLQTRNGKRTARAALRIAVEMVDEGLLQPAEALTKVDPNQLDQLLHPGFDPKAKKTVVAKGIAASPGCVGGKAALTPEKAEEMAGLGDKVILVRIETSPEDLKGMAKSLGFLTARGGKTSHAAVVARQMGKACVSGCSTLSIDEHQGTFGFGSKTYREGDLISLDGSMGEIYEGAVPMVEAKLPEHFQRLMQWADEHRRLKVRVNADTPTDCRKAREFGAQGIGLCRTEHMFFQADRILYVRQMIMAKSEAERRAALDKLAPIQRGDFVQIFEIMDGLPCNIRLLDPPLHEFLPHEPDNQKEVADSLKIPVAEVARRVGMLHESNPMLGHRGCRLGITHPEIYEMQTRAIAEAAVEVSKKGKKVLPEIMIPLTVTQPEMTFLRERLVKVVEQVFVERQHRVDYQIGTMIETPRAALVAGQIAEDSEFFSFGTNDLTQMAFGFSRDDAGSFLPSYLERGVLPLDPFEVLDAPGVGRLMKMATEEGRKTRPNLKVGICGETGGEPKSIEFCHQIGLDYVSCSPYRIPTARLAAAQAALKDKKK